MNTYSPHARYSQSILTEQKNPKSAHLCSQGHLMTFHNLTSYPAGVFCNKCGKDIEVYNGYYHCGIDLEDHHTNCISLRGENVRL
jgi:hypothetical protein